MTAHCLRDDLRGLNQLVAQGSMELAHVVQELHGNIARLGGLNPLGARGPTAALRGSVYGAIRTLLSAISAGVDLGLRHVPLPEWSENGSRQADVWRAALNGILGDHLAATENPLAIKMHVRHAGKPLELAGDAIEASVRRPSNKLLLLVHGLCLDDTHWVRRSHDHGRTLSRALGYTPLYLRYNSGLHISTNGRFATEILEQLLAEWPIEVDEIAIVGHSMGALVARSACDRARANGDEWLARLRSMVFLGAPHHGAPLERGGHLLQTLLGRHSWTTPLARLGRLRSAGITDLRRGCIRDEDWAERDLFEDPLHPVALTPLPHGVDCYAIAGALHSRSLALHAQLVGDGLVPISSAFGDHDETHMSLNIPHSRRRLLQGVGHMAMLGHQEAYKQMHRWLKGASPRPKRRHRLRAQ